MKLKPLKTKSLFFAPMEGITSAVYRRTIHQLYPQWDYQVTDFLRVPSQGIYPQKLLQKHWGIDPYETGDFKDKNYFQILTPDSPYLEATLANLRQLNISWLDLNLGCPSKTVNGHGGGAYLLTDLTLMRKIVSLCRKNFFHRFSCKIRLGYHDTNNFFKIIQILQDEGVELITIHGRTRDQAYQGKSNWDLIAEAVRRSQVPVVANGDVWSAQDAHKLFSYTGCFGVMAARGALQTPWLAEDFYANKISLPGEIKEKIYTYFITLEKNYQQALWPTTTILKQLKCLCRYPFDVINGGDKIKRSLLLSNDLNSFMNHLRFHLIDSDDCIHIK